MNSIFQRGAWRPKGFRSKHMDHVLYAMKSQCDRSSTCSTVLCEEEEEEGNRALSDEMHISGAAAADAAGI